MWNHNYYVYIITNYSKTVIYIGVTSDLNKRLYEHEHKIYKGFASKNWCHYLLYHEHFTNINYAIDREKEIKKWRREKKIDLIKQSNPEFRFLNSEVTAD